MITYQVTCCWLTVSHKIHSDTQWQATWTYHFPSTLGNTKIYNFTDHKTLSLIHCAFQTFAPFRTRIMNTTTNCRCEIWHPLTYLPKNLAAMASCFHNMLLCWSPLTQVQYPFIITRQSSLDLSGILWILLHPWSKSKEMIDVYEMALLHNITRKMRSLVHLKQNKLLSVHN